MRTNLKTQIEAYLAYDQKQRHLSQNTLLAYRQDLMALYRFVQQEQLKTWSLKGSDLSAFLASQRIRGKADSSIRRLISSIHKFYQWLLRHDFVEKDPTIKIDAPKVVWQPAVFLTQSEVECLLAVPDTTKALGLRNRAILEILYASGMQVNELIHLQLADIHFELKLVRVTGTNQRERLIPTTASALSWLQKYEQKSRPLLIHQAPFKSKTVFLNQRGQVMSRQAIWLLLKRYRQQAKLAKKVTPQTLRYTLAHHLLVNGADLRVIHQIMGYRENSLSEKDLMLTPKQLMMAYQLANQKNN